MPRRARRLVAAWEFVNGCCWPVRPSALRGGQGLTAVIGQTVVGTQGLEPASHIGAGLKSGWRRRYVHRSAAFDAAVIVATTAIAQSAQFGTHPATFRSEALVCGYIAASSALIIAWFSALILLRNRKPRVVDASLEEPRLRGVRLWLERLEFVGAPACLALRRIFRSARAGAR